MDVGLRIRVRPGRNQPMFKYHFQLFFLHWYIWRLRCFCMESNPSYRGGVWLDNITIKSTDPSTDPDYLNCVNKKAAMLQFKVWSTTLKIYFKYSFAHKFQLEFLFIHEINKIIEQIVIHKYKIVQKIPTFTRRVYLLILT